MFNNKKIKELEDRIKVLESKSVEKEGKPFFAEKRVQVIVYGAVAAILVAAINSFTGAIPW